MMLASLEWDSKLFGFRVGRIDLTRDSFVDFESVRTRAKQAGFRLLYVFQDCTDDAEETEASKNIISGSELVDVKLTYSRCLGDRSLTKLSNQKGILDSFAIQEREAGGADSQIQALALLAGSHSRFFYDQRICRQKATDLYVTWIEKCTRRFLADCVLETYGANGELAGFITFKTSNSVGSIGLFAVEPRFQGIGIGSLLLHEAQIRMENSGASAVTVVTQGRNQAACRAYLRSGYKLSRRERVFHVWL
ncbi:MAG: GNAT family N-acetyltransferase [Planctomycetota bacterium]|jgi:dTDP-4-amino-4,6-dideoxy-D-galactose acyltransferase